MSDSPDEVEGKPESHSKNGAKADEAVLAPPTPSCPPSSFWRAADDATGPSQRLGEDAQAHKAALRRLDKQLEDLRSTPLPRANPVVRYFLYFILFLLLLSVRDIRIYYQEVGDLLSLQRLYPAGLGGGVPGQIQLDLGADANRLAEELRVAPKDVQVAQEVIQRIVQQKRPNRVGILDWGIVLQLGNTAVLFGYNIFLNMLYAAGLASVLFLRNREMTQSKLIDRQNRELSILNERQALEMRETSRLLRVVRQAQSRLVASEKLASLGRLSATLAHEIRNPLGIISSSVGIVSEDLAPDTASGQAIGLIRHEVDRLNRIITELLDFARPQIPNPDYFDLNDLVRGWVRPLEEELATRKVRMLAELESVPPEVYVDSDQLFQAFLNLIFNAADAGEAKGGGDIVVSTKTESAETVLLQVRDQGVGIPPEVLAQVFEPFFTTKTTGSGLGLSVVKQTIEGMGGGVSIQSVVGEGTTVQLRLPTGPSSLFLHSRSAETAKADESEMSDKEAETAT